MKKLVLASGSERRIQLLQGAGYDLTIRPSRAEEGLPPDISPKDAVLFLSLKKALSAEEESMDKTGETLIAADTVVVFNNTINGKPTDREDALSILMKLSGETHSVLTGVTLLKIGKAERKCFYEETLVSFRSYKESDLEEYLGTEEPYDKAGAYAIQGYFSRFIKEFNGDNENVVGLPLKRVIQELEGF